jgi:hypothetical protein
VQNTEPVTPIQGAVHWLKAALARATFAQAGSQNSGICATTHRSISKPERNDIVILVMQENVRVRGLRKVVKRFNLVWIQARDRVLDVSRKPFSICVTRNRFVFFARTQQCVEVIDEIVAYGHF